MSNFAPISNITDQAAEDQRKELEALQKAEKKAEHKGSGSDLVDPLILAFFLLLEASNTSTQSAIIHAKQLNQNAISQQRLNAKAATLRWYSLPIKKENRHSFKSWHGHWTWHWEKHHTFHYWTYKNVVWYTSPNGAIVDEMQTKNEAIAAERQLLADRLTVMQQQAQVGETGVNTINDEAMQTMQEGGNLIQILQSLTYHALLRHPVQG